MRREEEDASCKVLGVGWIEIASGPDVAWEEVKLTRLSKPPITRDKCGMENRLRRLGCEVFQDETIAAGLSPLPRSTLRTRGLPS